MPLTAFPKQFKLVNELVSEIHFLHPLSPDDRYLNLLPSDEVTVEDLPLQHQYYDFFVTLKDGRCFGFTACTPEFLRYALQRDGTLSWVDSGLVVVGEITIEAMLDALEACLDKAHLYGLEHFGFQCTDE